MHHAVIKDNHPELKPAWVHKYCDSKWVLLANKALTVGNLHILCMGMGYYNQTDIVNATIKSQFPQAPACCWSSISLC